MLTYGMDDDGATILLSREERVRLAPLSIERLARIAVCEKCNSSLTKHSLVCSENSDHAWIFVPLQHIDLMLELCEVEKKRSMNAERAATRQQAMIDIGGFHSKNDINEIWVAQGQACYYCGDSPKLKGDKQIFVKDHMRAVANGGTEWPSNIALSCYQCNRDKSDKSVSAFWKLLQRTHSQQWISRRQLACKKVDKLKSDLTKLRKLELKHECALLEEGLKVVILSMAKSQLDKQKLDMLMVTSTSLGIEISFGSAMLRMSPSSDRKVKSLRTSLWIENLARVLLERTTKKF
jgi:hypothetical protein